jgi:hypothetical protein
MINDEEELVPTLPASTNLLVPLPRPRNAIIWIEKQNVLILSIKGTIIQILAFWFYRKNPRNWNRTLISDKVISNSFEITKKFEYKDDSTVLSSPPESTVFSSSYRRFQVKRYKGGSRLIHNNYCLNNMILRQCFYSYCGSCLARWTTTRRLIPKDWQYQGVWSQIRVIPGSRIPRGGLH